MPPIRDSPQQEAQRVDASERSPMRTALANSRAARKRDEEQEEEGGGSLFDFAAIRGKRSG